MKNKVFYNIIFKHNKKWNDDESYFHLTRHQVNALKKNIMKSKIRRNVKIERYNPEVKMEKW